MTEVTTSPAGDLGTFKGGSGFPIRFQGASSGELPFFKISDMNLEGNEIYMVRANHYISESQRKLLGATRIPAGAIVFAKVGAAVFLERKRILTQDSCIDNNMGAFIFDTKRLDTRLAHYLLLNFNLSSFVATTALPSLNSAQLRTIPLRVPTEIADQHAIVEALVAADDHIEALRRSISKKQDVKRGVLRELLLGRARLPGFGDPWESAPVSELLDFKNGLNKASRFFGHGTPIVNFMDVMKSTVMSSADVNGLVSLTNDEIRRYSAKRGDLFFTRTSESVEEVGTAAVLVEDIPFATFSGFILRGRPKTNRIDPVFLARLFELEQVRRQVTSSASYTTRALTNGGSLGRVQVAIPSRAEQAAIVDVAEAIDAELTTLARRLKSAHALKQGMMHQLLTGRTRLAPNEVAA